MFGRVLCALALVAMMGTVALGAPTITVTNAVTTADGGSGTPREYSPAPSTPMGKGETHTLYFFADGLDTATTANGGGSTTLASFGFHMEESGDSLSFSAPEIRFNETEIVGFDWVPRTGFSGNFEDLDLTPDAQGDEDWGWSVFSGTAAAVGGGTQFLGTLEVAIADDPNHMAPEDSLLELEPARAPAPGDTTMTQTLIETPGAQPGDVVNNVMWAGLAKTNLVVPGPTVVPLDIKPGSDPNPINLKSKGVLPVAILSTDDFDALSVDVDSLLFGDPLLIDEGWLPVAPIRTAEEDVTGDDLMDLTLKFSIPEMLEHRVLGALTEEGYLTGTTLDGNAIAGSDAIRIVGGVRSIPEPSTFALVVLGFVGLLTSTWRQRKHTA